MDVIYERNFEKKQHIEKNLMYFCKSKLSVAQLVEQLTLNQRVEGSSPSGETLIKKHLKLVLNAFLFSKLTLKLTLTLLKNCKYEIVNFKLLKYNTIQYNTKQNSKLQLVMLLF